MRSTKILWTLVVPHGAHVTLLMLVVPYAAYNNFVDVSRPSTRFESFRAYYSPNVEGEVASGLKGTMATQCGRVPEKAEPATIIYIYIW